MIIWCNIIGYLYIHRHQKWPGIRLLHFVVALKEWK